MKKVTIGYEQTDRDLTFDIYGLEFTAQKLNKELQQKVEELHNASTIEECYKAIDLLLGDGAAERINAKRHQDGYGSLDANGIISIIGLVTEAMAKQINSSKNYYEQRLK